jgi:hypothetical protein
VGGLGARREEDKGMLKPAQEGARTLDSEPYSSAPQMCSQNPSCTCYPRPVVVHLRTRLRDAATSTAPSLGDATTSGCLETASDPGPFLPSYPLPPIAEKALSPADSNPLLLQEETLAGSFQPGTGPLAAS